MKNAETPLTYFISIEDQFQSHINDNEFVLEWGYPTLMLIGKDYKMLNNDIQSYPEDTFIAEIDAAIAELGIEEDNSLTAKKISLEQNYPNPFNPETQISFYCSANGKVNLSVYNVKGELVQTLVDKNMQAGNNTVNFNGAGLNSGVYYYTLKAAGETVTRKMVLTK